MAYFRWSPWLTNRSDLNYSVFWTSFLFVEMRSRIFCWWPKCMQFTRDQMLAFLKLKKSFSAINMYKVRLKLRCKVQPGTQPTVCLHRMHHKLNLLAFGFSFGSSSINIYGKQTNTKLFQLKTKRNETEKEKKWRKVR